MPPMSREHRTPPPDARGDADGAFAAAAVQLEAEYLVPAEHHNPMELFAATVVRHDDGTLTVYDKTQGVLERPGLSLPACSAYAPDELRVVSPFVGGAFGSGLRPQYHVFLAVLAARELKRSVRVSLTRQQMFSLRAPPRHLAARRARRLPRRHAGGRHPRGDRRDLAVRGLSARRSSTGRACSTGATTSRSITRWSSSTVYTPMRHAGAGRRLGRVRARDARWTSWPSSSASTRSSCGCRTTPRGTRTRTSRSRARSSAPATGRAPSGSAGRAATPSRGRCARATARRLGHGRRACWEAQQRAGDGESRAHRRRQAHGEQRDGGHRHRHLHDHDADRRRDSLGLPIEDVTFTLGDSSLPNAPVEGGSLTAASVGLGGPGRLQRGA